jgi:hypothetical protein
MGEILQGVKGGENEPLPAMESAFSLGSGRFRTEAAGAGTSFTSWAAESALFMR